MRRLQTFFWGTIFIVQSLSTQADTLKPISVSFRFDDYCAMWNTAPGNRILSTFLAHRTPITFAVIPYGGSYVRGGFPTLPAEATEGSGRLLRDALNTGLFEVALHGFSHQENYRDLNNNPSEFMTLPLQEQVDRMRTGKSLLEGMIGHRVSLFVPPWNSYDSNTLRASVICGLKSFSAGDMPGRVAQGCTLKFRGTDTELKSLKDRIAVLRTSTEKKPVATVLFHAYDFTEYNTKLGTMNFDKLDDLLNWVNDQPDVLVKPLSRTAVKIKSHQ